MNRDTKEQLKNACRELGNTAMKEGAQLARKELPGLIGRIRAWIRKRRESKAAKR